MLWYFIQAEVDYMVHMNIQGNIVELMVVMDPNNFKEHPRMKKMLVLKANL